MAQCLSMNCWANIFLLHCFEVVVHWRLTLQWCQTLSPAQRGQWKQHRLKPMMLSLLPLLQMLSWWHLSKVGFKSFHVGILFLFCISLVPRLKKGREKDLVYTVHEKQCCFIAHKLSKPEPYICIFLFVNGQNGDDLFWLETHIRIVPSCWKT